jgi:O-antigen ligase
MLVVGMLVLEYARVIPSTGIIGLFATALFSHRPGEFIKNFYTNKPLFIFSFSCLFLLTGYFYSSNTDYFWERMQIQAPALLLPMAFANLKPLSRTQYLSVISVFVLLICVTAAGSLYIYAANYKAITESYLYSKVIPNPLKINHVRLSLMTASACFMGWYLFRNKVSLCFNAEPKLYLGCSLFLVLFLHIYSVRSGMLGLYSGCFVLIIYQFIIKQKAYKKGVVILLAALFLPIGAVMVSPTLKNKTLNTIGDLNRYQTGASANNYPMATRFVSYNIAFQIASYNPFFGCGLGDLEDELRLHYALYYPTISPVNRIIPHNQFIYYYVATGIVGLLIFIIAFYYPVLAIWQKKIFIAAMHLLIVSFSFLVEPTLETQLGVAVAISFILIPIWCESKPQKEADVR